MTEAVNFPELPEPFGEALKACIAGQLELYDVVGVLAAGTIIRGTPDPASDLDVHVLHRGSFRERVQTRFNGVACEIFVNPPARIPKYFAAEAKDRRPLTAHMFATGFVVFDPEGLVADLSQQARVSLLSPPATDPTQPPSGSYHAATLFEDAEDLMHRDPDAALLLLGMAVCRLAECRVAAEPGWLPRPKDLMMRLKEIDPDAADLVIAAETGGPDDRMAAGRRLCEHVTGAPGFFEWTSERESCLETQE